jgi:hypothetical protein
MGICVCIPQDAHDAKQHNDHLGIFSMLSACAVDEINYIVVSIFNITRIDSRKVMMIAAL